MNAQVKREVTALGYRNQWALGYGWVVACLLTLLASPLWAQKKKDKLGKTAAKALGKTLAATRPVLTATHPLPLFPWIPAQSGAARMQPAFGAPGTSIEIQAQGGINSLGKAYAYSSTYAQVQQLQGTDTLLSEWVNGQQSALFRFTFPEKGVKRLWIRLPREDRHASQLSLALDSLGATASYSPFEAESRWRLHLNLAWNAKPLSFGLRTDEDSLPGEASGQQAWLWLDFPTTTRTLGLKVGISHRNQALAANIRQEETSTDWDTEPFCARRRKALEAWLKQQLGPNPKPWLDREEARIGELASQAPISEQGAYLSPFDEKMHLGQGLIRPANVSQKPWKRYQKWYPVVQQAWQQAQTERQEAFQQRAWQNQLWNSPRIPEAQ